jgi:hypothetical protein
LNICKSSLSAFQRSERGSVNFYLFERISNFKFLLCRRGEASQFLPQLPAETNRRFRRWRAYPGLKPNNVWLHNLAHYSAAHSTAVAERGGNSTVPFLTGRLVILTRSGSCQ